MNRTKKFLYNSLYTSILQVVVMIVGFITPRVMLRAYGSEINGLVSSLVQFISYFNLVEAGLSGAAVFALYKPLADANHREINGIVSAAKRFYIQAGYIFVILTLVLACSYSTLKAAETLTPFSVFILTLILGINGCLEFFTLAKYRVILTADQKTYVVSIASIVQTVISTIIIVVLAKIHINIVFLRFLALTPIFIRSAILLIYCRKNYSYLDYNEKPNKGALNKRWDVIYQQILGTVQNGAPVVLATIFLSLKTVSIYTIYNMVIGGLNGILSIFISGLSAGFGDLIARNELDILKKSTKEFEFAYYYILTIIYSTALIMIMPFITIYTAGITDTKYNVPLLGFLFVVNGLFYNIKTPQSMLIISAGLYQETRIRVTIQGLIIVCLGIALAPTWGLPGILIASIASNVYRTIDLLFFVPKNITKVPISSSMFRMLRVLISVCIIAIPFMYIKVSANNYFHWVLNAVCVGVYAVVVTSVIGILFDRTEIKGLMGRMKFFKRSV